MSESFEDAREQQQQAAEQRFAATAEERQANVEALSRPGGVAEVNSAEQIARRLDRVTRYYAGEPLPTSAAELPAAAAEPTEVIEAALERAVTATDEAAPGVATEVAEAAAEVTPGREPASQAEEAASEIRAGLVLEKIINTADFVGIRYLEAGVAASRAVCRVDIRNALGRTVGYGTGSLVSPRLLLTNHHVLPSPEVASLSAAEFDFQDGLDGQPLQSHLVPLDPDTFFINDKERDFAVVALRARDSDLARYGLNRLIEAQGKAIVGDFVTIVQHPRGEKKQVALRDNKIITELELFLHYEADTEPGSSGSPVFNDQWEVVALHHASVPTPELGAGTFLNEGIRASRILHRIAEQQYTPAQRALVDQLLSPQPIRLPMPAVSPAATDHGNGESLSTRTDETPQTPEAPASSDASGGVRVTVPLEITVRLGQPAREPTASIEQSGSSVDEVIQIDPRYEGRRGYDEDFLGRDFRVALPTLSPALVELAARTGGDAGEDYVLKYHHFNVVLNKERRLAFFTAVNIDGETASRLKREADHWYLDPRLPVEDQTGEAVYADNDLDRGHLVRRLDPAWGRTRRVAKLANDDTFHFTNCTPQHKNFNQNKTTWAGLEDYILDNASNLRFRANVFCGPVFADDDDDYRGVKLPRQFWKVAVMVKNGGRLSATGYLLSQEELLRGLEAVGEFSYAAYRTYQVPIRRIEELTGISFGTLADMDPMAGNEATIAELEIDKHQDIIL